MKPTLKIILLFVITFLIGGMSGYFLSGPINRSIADDRFVQMNNRNRDYQQNDDRFREYMINELELRPEQIDTFFTVTRQSRRNMRQIMITSREESGQKIRTEVDSLNQKLSGILSPTQLKEWDRMQERYRHQQRGNSRN
jgi:hypothetical protein